MRLKDLGCAEVLVGAETGVNLCDELTTALGVRGNGTKQLKERRNKFFQAEVVRDAGLDAPRQVLASEAAHVEQFLSSFEGGDGIVPFKAVVKPVEGAGSDGVTICNAADEVRTAYKSLEGTKNLLGLANYEVLLQEFLHGTEYVVDTVSREGERAHAGIDTSPTRPQWLHTSSSCAA
jgi:biotin carboxylase